MDKRTIIIGYVAVVTAVWIVLVWTTPLWGWVFLMPAVGLGLILADRLGI